jgi:hypothetical protein
VISVSATTAAIALGAAYLVGIATVFIFARADCPCIPPQRSP